METASAFSIGIILIYLTSKQFKVRNARHNLQVFSNVFLLGIPLTGRGVIHALLFNSFCVLAIASHLRGAFADPGRMPEGMVRNNRSFSFEFFVQFNRKHPSKVSSWRSRTAPNAKEKRLGNLFAPITAKNVASASSR